MMDDQRQQQEQDEQQAYLWHLLQELKPHISEQAFQLAERDLGLAPNKEKQ